MHLGMHLGMHLDRPLADMPLGNGCLDHQHVRLGETRLNLDLANRHRSPHLSQRCFLLTIVEQGTSVGVWDGRRAGTHSMAIAILAGAVLTDALDAEPQRSSASAHHSGASTHQGLGARHDHGSATLRHTLCNGSAAGKEPEGGFEFTSRSLAGRNSTAG